MDQNTTQVIDKQGVRKLYPEGGTTTLFKSIRKKPESIGKLFKILSFIISYLLTYLHHYRIISHLSCLLYPSFLLVKF